MIKHFIIIIILFLSNLSKSQVSDSAHYKFIHKSSVYKTYLYTELLSYFLRGVNLNANFLLNKKNLSANYLRIFLGFAKDDYKIQIYPQYPSENRYSFILMYTYCMPLKKTIMEFGVGPAMLYGDPVARYKSPQFGISKVGIQLVGSVTWRYNLIKVPITCALSILPTYDHFSKVNFFALPSASIGYAIKRLDYEPKKIRVYY